MNFSKVIFESSSLNSFPNLKVKHFGYLFFPARDVPMGARGVAPPSIFSHLQESWSKVSQAAKRVGHNIFCDLFFINNSVTIIGQLVRTPSPPQQKVLRHINVPSNGTCNIVIHVIRYL